MTGFLGIFKKVFHVWKRLRLSLRIAVLLVIGIIGTVWAKSYWYNTITLMSGSTTVGTIYEWYYLANGCAGHHWCDQSGYSYETEGCAGQELTSVGRPRQYNTSTCPEITGGNRGSDGDDEKIEEKEGDGGKGYSYTCSTFTGYFSAQSGGTQYIGQAGFLPNTCTFDSNTTLYARYQRNRCCNMYCCRFNW